MEFLFSHAHTDTYQEEEEKFDITFFVITIFMSYIERKMIITQL